GVLGIAVGRVLPDKIGNRNVAAAVECELRIVAGEIELRVLAVLGARLQIRQSRAPTVARADVPSGMHVDGAVADAILVAIGPGKVGTIADFCAELEELI